jgi:hypothetical protein
MPLALLVAVTVCLLIAGLGAARDAHVGEPTLEDVKEGGDNGRGAMQGSALCFGF